MNIGRRLAEGVAGWLMYEYHSFRAQLFSEKYLTTPIGNILAGVYNQNVVAEFNHPVLQSHKKGPGRPPQIDFVIREGENIKIAVESKWLNKTQIGVADIIWDMIRLELIAEKYDAKCYFVLAGPKAKLQNLFLSERYLEKKSNGRTRPILRLQKNIRKSSIRIDSPPPKRGALIVDRMKMYHAVSMPSSIGSSYPEHYPKECRNVDNQVYVWEIFSLKNPPRFLPKDNANYK